MNLLNLFLLLGGLTQGTAAGELRSAVYDEESHTLLLDGWIRPTDGEPALAWIARNLQGTERSAEGWTHRARGGDHAGQVVFAYDPATRTATCAANLRVQSILSLGTPDGSFDPLAPTGEPDETLLMEGREDDMPALLNDGILIAYESRLTTADPGQRIPSFNTSGTFQFVRCELRHLTGFAYTSHTRVYLEGCRIANFGTLLADHWTSWGQAAMSVVGCRLERGETAFFLYHTQAERVFQDNVIADCAHTFHLLGQGRVAAINTTAIDNLIMPDEKSPSALATQHWLTLTVKDEADQPYPGLDLHVQAINAPGEAEFDGVVTTDERGEARLALTEKVQTNGASDEQTTTCTPHELTCRVPTGTRLRLEGSEPAWSVRVTLTEDQRVTVHVPGRRPSPPTPTEPPRKPRFTRVDSGASQCFGVLRVDGEIEPDRVLVLRVRREPVIATEYSVDLLDLVTDRKRLRADFSDLRAHRINALFVSWGTLLGYAEAVPLLLREAHHAGLLLFAFAFHCPGEGDFLAQHPELRIVNQDGQPVDGVACLNRPDYLDFLRPRIRSTLVERGLTQIDGLQIDEPGYPLRSKSWNEGDFFCYCDHCQAKFAEQYGFPLPRPAQRETEPDRWAKLIAFRQQTMTNWLQAICDAAREVAPSLTTQVNFIPEIDSTWQHQQHHYTVGEGYSLDLHTIAQIDRLDNVQIDPYWALWHREPTWVGSEDLGRFYLDVPHAQQQSVYYWIQGFEGEGSDPLSPGEVTIALDGALQRGVDGVSIWRYRAGINGADGSYHWPDYFDEFAAAVAPYCDVPVPDAVIRLEVQGKEETRFGDGRPGNGANRIYRFPLPFEAEPEIAVTVQREGLKPGWKWEG